VDLRGAVPPAAAPVVTGAPGSFARSVLAERHPALVRQVRDAFPYPPQQQRALDALLEETAHGVITALPAGARDRAAWQRWGRPYVGRPWFDVPFLWAESYFYRRLLGAVGYFGSDTGAGGEAGTEAEAWAGPGAWRGIDPFGPFKRAELRGTAVAEELAALDAVAELAPDAQDSALLRGALWGNRADLVFRVTAGEGSAAEGSESGGDVLVDDGAPVWETLDSGPPGAVHLIADNAGRELVADLVLVDHLLRTGRADTVVLHVKPYPSFVSDATTADVVDCLRRIGEAPGRAGAVGARLWRAMAGGQLSSRAHPFFCAPLPYADMPADLRADLAPATLVLAKGDLNYRRLVGDRHWPATTSFTGLTSYFPGGGLVALRTLKSDVIVGLDPATRAALDASGEAWRTSGTRAVIQARG
jgi:Damage-control phosphatase ARMT1-like domain